MSFACRSVIFYFFSGSPGRHRTQMGCHKIMYNISHEADSSECVLFRDYISTSGNYPKHLEFEVRKEISSLNVSSKSREQAPCTTIIRKTNYIYSIGQPTTIPELTKLNPRIFPCPKRSSGENTEF